MRFQFFSLKGDTSSGVITALFAIPAGMAYAKLAGVDPIFGLYSGMFGTLVASLVCGTPLMITTLTSAIAISTKSILDGLSTPSPNLQVEIVTLTFLIGIMMLVMGVFRLGRVVDHVSQGVMTGFVAAAAILIIIGELGDLVGYKVIGENKLDQFLNWIDHFRLWNLTTTLVGAGSILGMLLCRCFTQLKHTKSIFVLLLGTVIVSFFNLTSVSLVGDIAKIPRGLPSIDFPAFHLFSELFFGAFSVAMVALLQGAGVATLMKREGELSPPYSRDFVAQGVGNIFGSLFLSLGIGGSLTRTAVSVSAGAKSRYGGVFAALFLILFIYIAAPLIDRVPLAVISGILAIVALELLHNRLPEIMMILKGFDHSTVVMLVTFVSAFLFPLQWSIIIGTGLSLLFYIVIILRRAKH